ncbi:UNVERIFIED_CONTAM: hypothetical protein GTU68_020365 [Idotea baltica]|nr:hypothetical protein [Idotea baltica]
MENQHGSKLQFYLLTIGNSLANTSNFQSLIFYFVKKNPLLSRLFKHSFKYEVGNNLFVGVTYNKNIKFNNGFILRYFQNLERVRKLAKTKKNNLFTAFLLGAGVLGIYSYSIFAVKQEKFLDEID